MPRRHYEVKDQLDQVQKAKRRLEEEAGALRARVDAGQDDDGVRERLSNVQRGIERRDVEVAELEGEWGQAITEALHRGDVQTETVDFDRHAGRAAEDRGSSEAHAGQPAAQARFRAMRTVERHVNSGDLSGEAADRVDGVLRGADAPSGLDARYIETHGSAAYERAFAKLLRWGDSAALRMTIEEQQAVQAANGAEEMRTAMVEGAGSSGGFGIPIAVDPTINLSSSGVLNPIRQLVTGRTMSTRELRLVTSDGVTAQYQAEAAEAIDNSPVLAQPVLTAQRCTSFVPFSWELDQDWPSLAAELTQLVADAKDVLEATKVLLGSGTNEPSRSACSPSARPGR